MIEQFAQFQYTHLFLRERLRAGLLTIEGFRFRMAQMGYTHPMILAEIRDVMEEMEDKATAEFYI